MGWFSGKSTKSTKSASVEAHHLVATTAPTTRTPGSPISVLNHADPIRAGVNLVVSTAFGNQPTTVTAILRGGVPLDVLGTQEEGELVLSEGTDLSEIYRTAAFTDAEDAAEPGPGELMLRVESFEQQGPDLYVTGPYVGPVAAGRRVTLTPALGRDLQDRFTTVTRVDQRGYGRLGVLIADWDGALVEVGDEIYGPAE